MHARMCFVFVFVCCYGPLDLTFVGGIGLFFFYKL